MQRSFVWQNERPKIALNILQGAKMQGGLGLSNILLRDRALKIQWIYRLQNNTKLKKFVYADLENILPDWIWQIHLPSSDIKFLNINLSSFWADVLKAWLDLTYNSPHIVRSSNQSNIMVQLPNPHGAIFFPKWTKGGLWQIKDIIDMEGKILSYKETMDKLGFTVPFTELYGLWEAIPQRWKFWLKEKGVQSF